MEKSKPSSLHDLAFKRFKMQENLLNLWQSYGDYFLSFLKSGFILALGILLAFFIRRKIKQAFLQKDEILGNFIAQVVFVCLLILSVITMLGTLGIQTNSIVALLGTTGLAIALGLKNSLSNLASGIMLIILRPFKKNDLIEIGQTAGQVKSVNLFQTTLNLPNGTQAIIPNETIAKATIINHATPPGKKLKWNISLDWQGDMKILRQNFLDALSSCKSILDEPSPSLKITSLSNEKYTLSIQLWISNLSSQDALLQDFTQQLKIPISNIEILSKD